MAIARKKTASGKTRYYVTRVVAGKRTWMPGGYSTMKEARAADAKLTTAKASGSDITPNKETVAELLAQWSATKAAAGKHRSRTSEEYARFIGSLPEDLTSKRLADVRPADVQRVVDGMVAAGLAPGTIERRHRILAAAFAYALRTGRLATNPATTVERPQVTRSRLSIPTGEQVGRILDASTRHPLHAALVLGAYSGLRRGEVLGLAWSDLDLDAGMLTVRRAATFSGREVTFDRPKTGNAERTMPLHPRAVEVLREHRREQAARRLAIGPGWREPVPGGLVFDSGDGSPVHPDRLGLYFRRLVRRLGMEGVRLHDLRHSALSSAMRAGIAPLIVSRMAGHSRSSFTMDQYGHVAPSDALAAVSAIGEAVAW